MSRCSGLAREVRTTIRRKVYHYLPCKFFACILYEFLACPSFVDTSFLPINVLARTSMFTSSYVCALLLFLPLERHLGTPWHAPFPSQRHQADDTP